MFHYFSPFAGIIHYQIGVFRRKILLGINLNICQCWAWNGLGLADSQPVPNRQAGKDSKIARISQQFLIDKHPKNALDYYTCAGAFLGIATRAATARRRVETIYE
jgi:hypothetical protein